MTSQFIRTLGLAAVAVALSCASAPAATINNSTGLTNPWQTVTFSELQFGAETAVTTQYQSQFGVSFNAAAYYYPAGNQGAAVNPTDMIGNFTVSQPPGQNQLSYPFVVQFTAPQSAAAFLLETNGGPTLIEALLNGNVVESFTPTTTNLANNPTPQYVGFQDIIFDAIRITPPGDNVITTAALLLDNLQTTGIPEPATIAVLGGGLIALGYGIRRRRRQDAQG